ncbi:phage tail tape measure protein [Clostridium felsineum]|uniref:phage tail tape measure protein n=1 Tax=Clostridium felsineum TaxID=36839 RepID=UPI00214D18DC|nr:phage tail tape measure protein [Clostridium felsineum]MCR3760425.1 phage tail tape measure protein [Clostridium felsineum]
MSATLDLGALSYTLKINGNEFSSGISKAKEEMNGLGGESKSLTNSNKELATSFINAGSKINSFGSAIKENNTSIKQNKATMAELSQQISVANLDLKSIKETFGESSLEYKKASDNVKGLEREYKNIESETNNLKRSNNDMKQSIAETGTKIKETGDKMSSIGMSMSAKVTAPIVAGFTLSAKSAGEFDHQMADIKKELLALGMPIDEVNALMKEMSQDSIQWSEQFGQSTSDINAGLLTFKKDGYSAREAIDDMKTSLYTARGANENLNDVINTLGGSLEAYGMKTDNASQNTKNMSHIADAFAYTANHTKASVTSLGEGMSIAGQTLSGMNQPIEVTAAALGELASNNIDASTAANALKAGFVNLTKPTDQTQEAMKKMKLNVFDAKGQMEGLPTILSQIESGTKGWTEEQKNAALATVFGKESLATWNALLNKGSGNLTELANGAKNSNGEVQRLSNSMKDTPVNQYKELKESIAALGITLGQDLLPMLTPIIQKITSAIQAFSKMDDGTKKIIVTLGLAAAAIGPVLVSIGHLITAIGTIHKAMSTLSTAISGAGGIIGALTSPVGIAIIAITALAVVAALIITHWKPISNFFKKLWQDVTSATSSAWNGIKSFFSGLWSWISSFFSKWGTVILAVLVPFIGVPLLIAQHWGQIKEFFSKLWSDIKTGLSSAWKGIVSALTNTWKEIETVASSAWHGIVSIVTPIVQFFANGITNIWRNMSTGVSNVLTGLKTTIKGIWEAIKTIVLAPVLLILDLVTGNFKKLGSDVKLIFTNLQKAFSNIWNGIKQICTGAVQAISGFCIGVFQNASSNIQAVWNALSTFFSWLWNGIVSTAQSAWNGLVSFLNNLWNNIINTAQSTWNGFRNFFQNLWAGIVNTIQGIPAVFENVGNTIVNAWNTVVSFFTSLPGKFASSAEGIGAAIVHGFDSAISFITSLPSKALEWGKDFIDGLINGITGGIGKIGDAVSGVADKIRSFLHFSVPDEGPLVDYESWMPDFLTGLTNGINKNKTMVTNAIKSMSTDMKLGLKINPETIGATQKIPTISKQSNKGNSGIVLSFNNVTINGYPDLKKVMRDAYNISQDYQRGKGL